MDPAAAATSPATAQDLRTLAFMGDKNLGALALALSAAIRSYA